jgi:glycosyltransferase involved in cell wall biosynthesis
MQLLSIIIPVYNEINTIEKVLNKIDSLVLNDYHKQIIVVDDYSNDGTREYLKSFKVGQPESIILFQKKNCGKGHSIKKGLQYVNGDYSVIVDADEEVDISVIIEWLSYNSSNVDAVIGIRQYESIDNYIYYLGRHIFSVLFRKLFHTDVQDPLVGLKLMKSSVIKSMELRSKGFGIDSEIIIKLIKGGYNFEQKPIIYTPRKTDEGKKIRPYHAIKILALWFKEAGK